MIFNAIVLAIVTFVGMMLIYMKLPNFIKKIMLKGDILTDIGCAALTYTFLGGTATAIIAAGLVGIMTSMSLAYVKSPQYQNNINDIKINNTVLKKT